MKRLVMALLVSACLPLKGWGHCDTLSGPVIKDARLAIARKDVTPVLKWVGKEDETEIAMTDESVAKGSAAGLLQDIGRKLDAGVRTRLARVVETSKHANDSVEAGREFVEAYVDYLHFAESLDTILNAQVHFDHGNEIKDLERKVKR